MSGSEWGGARRMDSVKLRLDTSTTSSLVRGSARVTVYVLSYVISCKLSMKKYNVKKNTRRSYGGRAPCLSSSEESTKVLVKGRHRRRGRKLRKRRVGVRRRSSSVSA